MEVSEVSVYQHQFNMFRQEGGFIGPSGREGWVYEGGSLVTTSQNVVMSS